MKIHETAYMTCAYRSSNVDISKDIYASLWNNEVTDLWVQKVTDEVSPYEPILHCLRNRFFLESIIEFSKLNPNGVLVNFGAGFSMYPYLLSDKFSCIDIDQEEIINHKSQQLNKWEDDGLLPKRDISYYAVDFRNENHDLMIRDIKQMISGRPSFIILEGVLYFLKKSVSDKLFESFARIQTFSDLLGCVSFLPESKETEVQRRLDDFFDRYNLTSDTFSYEMLSTETYNEREGYQLIKHVDYIELAKLYAPESNIADKSKILNENMYILKRI